MNDLFSKEILEKSEVCGFWKISTETSQDDTSPRNILGIYYGNIDSIAFALADKVYYRLMFERVVVMPRLTNTEDTKKDINKTYNDKGYIPVNNQVKFSIEDTNVDLVKLQNMFKRRNVTVSSAPEHNTWKLTMNEQSSNAFLRKKALSKLTQAEIHALNLK